MNANVSDLEHHLLEAHGAAEELVFALDELMSLDVPVKIASIKQATKLMERAIEMLVPPKQRRTS